MTLLNWERNLGESVVVKIDKDVSVFWIGHDRNLFYQTIQIPPTLEVK
jgi:hypothetical protein